MFKRFWAILMLSFLLCFISSFALADEISEEPAQDNTLAAVETNETVNESDKSVTVQETEEKKTAKTQEVKTRTKTVTKAAETASVEKVIVHFWIVGTQGQWVEAQGKWTATNGGTKKLEYYNVPARSASPQSVGDKTYIFDEFWVDDFGNEYEAKDVKLNGSDFIALFDGYTGPTAELNVYAHYTVYQDYYFNGIWTDNVANGGGSEQHIVNYKTGYTHTFETPADIPERYTFLYWDGGEYGQAKAGSIFEILAGSLSEDLTVEFVATYSYIPTSLVKVAYVINGETVYETPTSADPINIRDNAPPIENGQWLFETCPCVGEEAVPGITEPIITTTPVDDEPVINTVTVYGVLNGIDGKDGADGKDGVDGKDGRDGIDGKDGIDGQNGKDGEQGPQGEQGIQGEQGVAGQNGADGQDGVDGQQGLQGIQGPQGRPGLTSHTTSVQYIPSSVYVPSVISPFVAGNNSGLTRTFPLLTPGDSTETIIDDKTPLANGTDTTSNSQWALLNLLLMLVTVLVLIKFPRRNKNKDEDKEERYTYKYHNNIVGVLIAIGSVIAFILTENIWLPMTIVDIWTVPMAILCIGGIIARILSRTTEEEKSMKEYEEEKDLT